MQACRIYCHFTTWHKNCTAQVQVKPLDRSKGFTLHPLTDLFIPTPNRLLWEAFWPRSNYARTLFAHILLLRPIARYSFKQLSELGIVKITKMHKLQCKGDSNPDSLDYESGILPLSHRAPHRMDAVEPYHLKYLFSMWNVKG